MHSLLSTEAMLEAIISWAWGYSLVGDKCGRILVGDGGCTAWSAMLYTYVESYDAQRARDTGSKSYSAYSKIVGAAENRCKIGSR